MQNLIIREKRVPRSRRKIVNVALATKQVNASKSRNSRRNNKKSNMGSQANQFASGYLATLNDPFEYPPVKLGYDCYVASDLVTAYMRGSITVNADGTFSMVGFPCSQSLVLTNVSGAIGTTWTTLGSINATNILTNYGAGRTLSLGIRAFSNQGGGALSTGVFYAGAIPIVTLNEVRSFSAIGLSTLNQSEMGIGKNGACALGRPQDNDSFVFFQSNIVTNNTFLSEFSVPYITGEGFPVGTKIYYECIQNLEVLSKVTTGSIASSPNLPNQGPVASDFFPSPESLMSKIRPLISSSAVMDAVEAGVAIGLGPGAGSAVHAIRSSFNRGSHAMRSRQILGGESIRRSSQTSAVVEEYRDEL